MMFSTNEYVESSVFLKTLNVNETK